VLSSAAVTLDTDDASREAHVFARYLVGRPPTPETLARYVAARHAIWGDGAAADPLLAFVRRHPWSVAPLDAATSLFQRDGMLHGAILTMAAILETSPQFADQFLPRSVSRAALVGELVAGGVATAVQVVAGVLLLPLARRGRA
jgi:hypothetical protein